MNARDHLKPGQSGHVIGAHMFRSPEAMLSLRWGTPTDIWSFGTTVSDLDQRPCSFIAPFVLLVLLTFAAANKYDMGIRLAYLQARSYGCWTR